MRPVLLALTFFLPSCSGEGAAAPDASVSDSSLPDVPTIDAVTLDVPTVDAVTVDAVPVDADPCAAGGFHANLYPGLYDTADAYFQTFVRCP